MKYAAARPYADPEKAARRLMEHAHAFEPIQDGRIYIQSIIESHGGRLRAFANRPYGTIFEVLLPIGAVR